MSLFKINMSTLTLESFKTFDWMKHNQGRWLCCMCIYFRDPLSDSDWLVSLMYKRYPGLCSQTTFFSPLMFPVCLSVCRKGWSFYIQTMDIFCVPLRCYYWSLCRFQDHCVVKAAFAKPNSSITVTLRRLKLSMVCMYKLSRNFPF